MDPLSGVRSLLFVPGDDERKVARAFDSGADAVIVDLEDGVAPDRKEHARRLAAAVPPPDGPLWLIRVNAPDTGWGRADLAALADLPVDALVVPKVDPSTMDLLGDGPPVLALVETAAGLRGAFQVATRPRVVGLMLGGADLGAELGWQPRADGLELLHARSALVLDAAAAGVRSPFDVVFLDPRDADGLRAEATFARSLGLGGKACIHPAQVAVVNDVFSPAPAEVEAAAEIVAEFDRALARGRGVTVVRGRMVDAPVVARARVTLAAADHSGPWRSMRSVRIVSTPETGGVS